MNPLAIAASGVRSAELRLAVSAHNVANVATCSFRPLRVTQASVDGGGTAARVHTDFSAQGVDLAREFVEQMRAGSQLRASLRLFETASETRGRLVDLLA